MRQAATPNFYGRLKKVRDSWTQVRVFHLKRPEN